MGAPGIEPCAYAPVGTGSERQQPAKVGFFQGFRSDKGGRERQQTAAAEGISEAEVSPMFHPGFTPSQIRAAN
jgi:hypothetical protein